MHQNPFLSDNLVQDKQTKLYLRFPKIEGDFIFSRTCYAAGDFVFDN